MKKTAWVLAAATTIGALALSGCSASPASDDDRVQVVASTNVYGDIAASIGGDRVDVTSIIDDAAKDPHSYEASARDMLQVSHADLVIENGGGYDAFMEALRADSDAEVITAVEFSHDFPGADEAEHDHEHEGEDAHEHADEDGHEGHDHIEGFNEHVWFDVHTMIHVAEQISDDLTELDPDGSAEYEAGAKKLIAELEGFEKQLGVLHEKNEGRPIFMTEPLPGYLAAAVGLDDVTPDGFAEAVEEGNDVAPATLLAAVKAIRAGDVDAVLTTVQTGGGETAEVTRVAEENGVPVVPFSELLVKDQSYAEWMHDAIQSLSEALER
ncbi:zinc ABC transporter substrate-binding protein [Microbacterium sp. KUDC0406]|uniref:metal ABC transporter solute-binding protein, Zn/Mn family n=1 Tax=Microbacterium sp. KUDC0406 TaxID=2909588 RepID=UPI001F2AFBBF|nr:zinc ABC transporter substrate-binding protein [Microbacterium sp. KUDC0406]UJP09668.1 zinc ABC transporter substrate-binding protein [Microbacterium sp. KUDC0406]